MKKRWFMAGRLVMFFGIECEHCHDMDPLVEKLEKELKVEVKKIEVWHNAKNAALFEKLDKGECGGVPFFYNEKTKKSICGAVDYAILKKWAQG